MQNTSPLGSSAWEAFRLTSKTPSELMDTLGPHGIDTLLRQATTTCWRELPPENRNLPAAINASRAAFDRNIRHWASIRKATPAALFENLLPRATDGYIRQALVLCHMMMPRGRRGLSDAQRVVTHIFERNLAAWEEDLQLLTGALPKKAKKSKPKTAAKRLPRSPSPAKKKKPAKRKSKR